MILSDLARNVRYAEVANLQYVLRDALQNPTTETVGDLLVSLANDLGPYQDRANALLPKLTSRAVSPEDAVEQISSWFTAEEKKGHTTFEQAAVKAKVPTAVDWKFRTTAGGGGWGDNIYSGFVAYGRTASEHVFVAVRYVQEQNAWTSRDVSYYEMWVEREPISKPLSTVAPRLIRALWPKLGNIKGYNAKVYLLDPDTEFRALQRTHGNPVAFKDALVQLGEISTDDPMVKDRKLTVELRTRGRIEGLKSPQGILDIYRLVFVINGKEYPVSDRGCAALQQDSRKFMDPIFGDYVYNDSRKVVTRTKNAKAVLQYAATVLSSESQELRDLLTRAAERLP